MRMYRETAKRAFQRHLSYRAAALAVFCLLLIWPMAAKAADQAVVVMYHRFGEQDYPSTNIRIEQVEAPFVQADPQGGQEEAARGAEVFECHVQIDRFRGD